MEHYWNFLNSQNAVSRRRLLHSAPQLNATVCGPRSGNTNQGNGGGDEDNSSDGGWIVVERAFFLPCHPGQTLSNGVPVAGWLKLNEASSARLNPSDPERRISECLQNNADTMFHLELTGGVPLINRALSSDSLLVEAPDSDPSSMSSSGMVPVAFANDHDFDSMGRLFDGLNTDLVESQYNDILGQPQQEETWLWLTAQNQRGEGPSHLHSPHYAPSASTDATSEEEDSED